MVEIFFCYTKIIFIFQQEARRRLIYDVMRAKTRGCNSLQWCNNNNSKKSYATYLLTEQLNKIEFFFFVLIRPGHYQNIAVHKVLNLIAIKNNINIQSGFFDDPFKP